MNRKKPELASDNDSLELPDLEHADSREFDPQQLQAARKVLGLIKRVRQSRETSDDKALVDTAVQQQTPAIKNPQSDLSPGEIVAEHGLPAESLKIDRFAIKRQIGKGGYGLVFQAYDYQLDREVAVKIPRPEVVVNPDSRARFRREARAAAALSHPNIVPVFDSGGEGPVCFIVYQYIEGITLQQWLEQAAVNGGLDQKVVAALIATLAEAVGHAHQRGVLHRDLKPANVLLQSNTPQTSVSPPLESLVPMITDFGLAKIADGEFPGSEQTQTGAVIGTPAYMAPEQTRSGNQHVDVRTDVYSLGSILYEMLTGRSPFQGSGVLQVLQQVQNADPPHPGKLNVNVSGDLAAICMKCLEKSPSSRYENAWQLKADLQRFIDDRTVVARPASTLRKFQKWWRRNPALATAVTVATIAILTGLISVTALWLRSNDLRKQSDARGVKLAERKNELEIANQQLRTSSQQLNEALRGLFLEVATSREIKSPEAAPLRKKLLQRANQFYISFMQGQTDQQPMQKGRGQTLYELARVHEYLGDPEAALSLVQEAIQLIGSHADPMDLVRWHNYASLRLNQLGRFDEARNEMLEALKIVESADLNSSATHAYPGLGDHSRATLLTNLADLRIADNDADDALHLTAQALEIFDSLAQDPHLAGNGDHLFSRAVCYRIRGRAFSLQRQFANAHEAHDKAIEVLMELVKDAFTSHWAARLELGRSWYDKGVNHSRENDPVSARLCYQNALEQMDALPDTFDLQLIRSEEYFRIDYSIAVADMLQEHFADAEARILASFQPIRHFMDDQPQTRAEWLDSLGDRYNLLYVIRLRSPEKSDTDAEEAIRNAIECYRQALVDRPTWAEARLSLVQSQTNLGNILQRQEQLDGAWEQYRIAEEELDVLSRSKPKWAKVDRCRCNLLQGKMRTAVSERRFNEALEFCREANRFMSRTAVNHLLLEEARILAQLDRLDAAKARLWEFGEQEAIQPRDFIAAAACAMEIVKLFGISERTMEFRAVAIELLNKGARLQTGRVEQYRSLVSAHSHLTELVEEIDPDK